MSSSDSVSLYFPMIVGQLPLILVAIAGIVIAVANWQRSPSASLWALVGCALLLFSAAIFPFVQMMAYRTGGGNARTVLGVVGMFGSFVRAGSYVCLLAGVYIGRPRGVAPTAPPPPRIPA